MRSYVPLQMPSAHEKIFFLEERKCSFNPLPDMPILDSSSPTANKDMISKIWTNTDI